MVSGAVRCCWIQRLSLRGRPLTVAAMWRQPPQTELDVRSDGGPDARARVQRATAVEDVNGSGDVVYTRRRAVALHLGDAAPVCRALSHVPGGPHVPVVRERANATDRASCARR